MKLKKNVYRAWYLYENIFLIPQEQRHEIKNEGAVPGPAHNVKTTL